MRKFEKCECLNYFKDFRILKKNDKRIDNFKIFEKQIIPNSASYIFNKEIKRNIKFKYYNYLLFENIQGISSGSLNAFINDAP